MDLFEYMGEKEKEKESPLASRMRPRTLDEIVGQQHILGKAGAFGGRPGDAGVHRGNGVLNTRQQPVHNIRQPDPGHRKAQVACVAALVQHAAEDVTGFVTQHRVGFGTAGVQSNKVFHRSIPLCYVEDFVYHTTKAAVWKGKNPFFHLLPAKIQRIFP